ncbi:MAG: GGDEF domain-containing protein [Rhizobiaceae bacterium]|nr:GGDEF domain-containing protein [Rhizobiaceae bacterium]
MTLDYNSLLLALGISGGCLLITLLMSWSVSRTEMFLLSWATGVSFIIAYVAAYIVYVDHPNPLLGAACFLILSSGLATLFGAARQFRTGRFPKAMAACAAGCAAAFCVPPLLLGFDGLGFVGENIAAAALLGLTAREYWRGRSEAPGPIVTLVVLYATIAGGFLLCAGVLIADGRIVLGAAPQNWAEDVSLAISIAGMTGIGALSLALNHWRAAGRHRREAMTDALTGLLNRRALFDLHGNAPVGQFAAVIAFDLDDFKSVNDQYGHQVGDRVIIAFAAELSAAVGGQGSAARLGGEEFALVLPRCLPHQAERAAEAIRSGFAARSVITDRGALSCTVSAGVAFGTKEGLPFETALRLADKALYASKRDGRNRVSQQGLRLVQ